MFKWVAQEDLVNGDRVFAIDKYRFSCSQARGGIIGYVSRLDSPDILYLDVRNSTDRDKNPNVWFDGTFESSWVEYIASSSHTFLTDLDIDAARSEYSKLIEQTVDNTAP